MTDEELDSLDGALIADGFDHAYPVGWYDPRAPDRQLLYRTHGYVCGPGAAL